MELLKVKERVVANADGSVGTARTTLVTGKGQIYFINLLLKKENRVQNLVKWERMTGEEAKGCRLDLGSGYLDLDSGYLFVANL